MTGTIALLAAAIPTALAFSEDVAVFRKDKPSDGPDDGLTFSIPSTAANVIALLAPALAHPVLEAAKSMLGAAIA